MGIWTGVLDCLGSLDNPFYGDLTGPGDWPRKGEFALGYVRNPVFVPWNRFSGCSGTLRFGVTNRFLGCLPMPGRFCGGSRTFSLNECMRVGVSTRRNGRGNWKNTGGV